MEASFDLAAVEESIAGTIFAGQLHHLPSTPSTNTLALEAAPSGTTCGVWIADEQTAGRGRGGHAWHSAAGEGLYVSILIRPHLSLARGLWLSLATGLAARQAIAQVTSSTADIRWPNDLLLGGKKCGGILVETAIAADAEPPALRYAVIGIGINVDHALFPPELSELATSLRLETMHRCRREPLLGALLRCLHDELTFLEAGGATLLDRFAAASTWVRGKEVRVGDAGGYTGVTVGLAAEGFLLVRGNDGKVHTVLSGGVRAL